MPLDSRAQKWLLKKRRLGMRGYPVGTVAFYGPDDRRASKVAVGVIAEEGAEPTALERWFSEHGDVRQDHAIMDAVMAFLKLNGVRSVAIVDGILGCPHEEGKDYPLGEPCPRCPFWAERDRWAGRD